MLKNYVKKASQKRLFKNALSLAHEMLSSWFTDKINHVQDFVTRLREDIFPRKSRQNAWKINASF